MAPHGQRSEEDLEYSSEWDSPKKQQKHDRRRAQEGLSSPAASVDTLASLESIETAFEQRANELFQPESEASSHRRKGSPRKSRHKHKKYSLEEEEGSHKDDDYFKSKSNSEHSDGNEEEGTETRSNSGSVHPDEERDAKDASSDEKDRRHEGRDHRRRRHRSSSASSRSTYSRNSSVKESKRSHASRHRRRRERTPSDSESDGPVESRQRSNLTLRAAKNHKELESALVGAPGDDDLAARIAYEQLSSLAGMSRKIQDAVEHSKVVFEKRVHKVNMGILQVAFDGWQAARYGGLEKRKKLQRVLRRMARFKLAQGWSGWLYIHQSLGPVLRLLQKARATIRRGMKKRVLAAWREVNAEAQREITRYYREKMLLEKQEDMFRTKRENRALWLFRRRIMGRCWMALDFAAAKRREKRAKMNKALMHMKKRQLAKGWNGYVFAFLEIKRKKNLLKKALKRMANLKLTRAWNSWYELILAKRRRRQLLNKALLRMKNRMMSKGWMSWLDYIAWRRRKKKIIMRWMRPMMAKGFYGWVERHQEKMRRKAFARGCILKMLKRRLSKAYEKWCWFIEILAEERSGEYLERLQTEMESLRGENGRLRRDNERFVRLIDSGEWGRSRLEEMNQTGAVLREERKELAKLISKLRTDYEALEREKIAQAEELRMLKERLLNGNFVQRNKLLVKGGSSFNALNRALKQDVLEGPVLKKDPTLLYEVDKLSMDHISIFPDGDLNVQAVRRDRQPMSLSKGHHGYGAQHPEHRAAAVKRVRIPARLDGFQRDAVPAFTAENNRPSNQPGTKMLPASLAMQDSEHLPAGEGATGTQGKLVSTLKGMSPEEVDQLEEVIRQERAQRSGPPSKAPRPQSAHSSYRR